MRQTFNLTGDGFESLHFYQYGSVADKVMQGSHKPYECGFDSHLNLHAVKAHMDVHSADNRKEEGSNPSHSTNFNKVVDIEM